MKFRRLILANLFRKKVRLILTIGSFAVALVLFTFLAVVKSAFSRGTEIAGADRLIVVSRIGLMQLMPISHRDKILAIPGDRKSTRLNSSHSQISYAVFCLKKKHRLTIPRRHL